MPCIVEGIPEIAFLGHSMPRNLNRYLDTCAVRRGAKDPLFRELAPNEQYPHIFGLDSIYSLMHFMYSPTVTSAKYAQRIQEIVELNVDLVLIHASSNDLSGKYVCVDTVVNRVIDSMLHVIRHGHVKSVIFVSELKRADTPNYLGKGRLQCSPEVFRERVMLYNSKIEEKCQEIPQFHYFWLYGFWWDHEKREIPIEQWSKDRLHPGPHFESEGFQKYFWAIRKVLYKGFHTLG